VEASALSAPVGLQQGTASSARWLRLRSDEQLVNLFRSGSEDAFGVIHDRYRQRLYAYSRQMLGGSGSDAEDVMQDVFLRAYRSLRIDTRPVSLRAWLYRVAHNRCVDHLRRPTPPPAEIFEVSRTPLHDPMAEAEAREDLARLVADVRRLPDQQRSALLMREMDGMSYADLAEALDTSVPAVKSLLVRARIGLVEAIEARDTDCADIRHDLAASYDKGVRASGRARRHLRDCPGCTRYRAQLREVRTGFAALSPAPSPMAGLAKLLGIGGAGSSAAAGSAAAGGSAATIGGGAAAAVSVTKVAVVVCCAVAVTGGAEVVQQTIATKSSPAPHHRAAPVAATPAPTAARHAAAVVVPAALARHVVARLRMDSRVVTPASKPAPKLADNGSGGVAAPADLPASPPPADTTTPKGDSTGSGALGTTVLPGDDSTPVLGGGGSSSTSGSASGSGQTQGTQSGSGSSSTSTQSGGGQTASGSGSSSTSSTSDSSPGASTASASSSSSDSGTTTASSSSNPPPSGAH
jgi:RNA polymerase sigma factor (sigma-70 family)